MKSFWSPMTWPVFWVRAKQRCQHHHFIFACSDLCDRQDLMLGLWMTDVQHRRCARLVLFQHTGSPVAHLHRVVRSELAFYILRGHLDSSGRKSQMWELLGSLESQLVNEVSVLCLLLFHLLIWHFLPLQLYLKKEKKKRSQALAQEEKD